MAKKQPKLTEQDIARAGSEADRWWKLRVSRAYHEPMRRLAATTGRRIDREVEDALAAVLGAAGLWPPPGGVPPPPLPAKRGRPRK